MGGERVPGASRRRATMIVSAIALAGLVGPALLHARRASEVPDAPEPFDLAAARGAVLPAGTDAYPLIIEARAKLGTAINPFAPMTGSRDFEWEAAPPEARAWIVANRPVLDAFRAATERPDALPERREAGGITAPAVPSGELAYWSRFLGLEAGRLEEGDDPGAAWIWHRARLRMVLLMAKRADHRERRLTSILFVRAANRASEWSERPGVAVAMIRQAIADVEAMEALHPLPSEMLRREYLRTVDDLADPGRLLLEFGPEVAAPPGTPAMVTATKFTLPGPLGDGARRVGWWLAGEPERTRRVVRLIFANWLAEADRPRGPRSRVVSRSPLVFEAAPGALPAAELARLADTSPLYTLLRGGGSRPGWFDFRLEQWPLALAADRKVRANLIVNLASRVYEIENGTYPASPDLLIGKVLPKLPDDFSPDGGETDAPPP